MGQARKRKNPNQNQTVNKKVKTAGKSGDPSPNPTNEDQLTAKKGNPPQSHPAIENRKPVVVLEGLDKAHFENPIALQNDLEKLNPLLRDCQIKPGRNFTLIITPKTTEVLVNLLKPWDESSHLGKLSVRLPKERKPEALAVIAKNVPTGLTDSDLQSVLSSHNAHSCTVTRFIKTNPDGTKFPLKVVKIDAKEKSTYDNLLSHGLKIGFLHVRCEAYVSKASNQCFNCQGWGHSHQSCSATPKCRWCAGDHDSRKCEMKDGLHKCANCQGNHPSHWGGCPSKLAFQKSDGKPTRLAPPSPRKQIPTRTPSTPTKLDNHCLDLRCIVSLAKTMYLCLQPFVGDKMGSNNLKTIISRAFNHCFGSNFQLYSPPPPTREAATDIVMSGDTEGDGDDV